MTLDTILTPRILSIIEFVTLPSSRCLWLIFWLRDRLCPLCNGFSCFELMSSACSSAHSRLGMLYSATHAQPRSAPSWVLFR
jgi:hypothetical protein